MLSNVVIDGYKSIDHQEVKLERFTLLAGVNSAGKSSVIQSILIVRQFVRNWDIQKKKQVNLGLGRFTDMRNSVKGRRTIDFSLDARMEGERTGNITVSLYMEENRPAAQITSMSSDYWKEYVTEKHLIHLPVERVGVEDSYDILTEDEYAIGDHGEYAYAYLALNGQDPVRESDFAYDPEKVGMSLNNQVNYWLEYLVGFRIQANTVPDLDRAVVTFSNAKDNRFYRNKNVGTGISYVALLLIAALALQKGDTLIIENPEIHLHPRAQSRFMECMAFFSERGLQIILETHSDHIYNGLRKCIKKKRLGVEDVAAYYLELDEEMQTVVQKIELNEQGAELHHPYGMFDQFDDDLDELLGM